MTTFDNYRQRFESAPWQPKATRTKMQNAPGDPPVTRLETPDHYATEQDNTVLYVPKSVQGQDYRTSNMPRIVLPYVEDGAVRNHAVVATTTSAAKVERERSWKQLQMMAADGNESAQTIVKSFEGLVIE